MNNPEFPSDPLPIDQTHLVQRSVPEADLGGTTDPEPKSPQPSDDAIQEIMAPPPGTEPGTNIPLPEIDYDPLEPPRPRQSVSDELMGDDCIDMEADVDTMRLRLVHVASVLGPLLMERGQPFTAGELVHAAAALAAEAGGRNGDIRALADTWVVSNFDIPYEQESGDSSGRLNGFVVVTPGGSLFSVEEDAALGAAARELEATRIEFWDDPQWAAIQEVEPLSTPMLSRSINAYVRSLGIPPEAFTNQ